MSPLSLPKKVQVKEKRLKRRMRTGNRNLKKRILKKTKLKQLPMKLKTITQTRLTLEQLLLKKRMKKSLMQELMMKLTKHTVCPSNTKMRNSSILMKMKKSACSKSTQSLRPSV